MGKLFTLRKMRKVLRSERKRTGMVTMPLSKLTLTPNPSHHEGGQNEAMIEMHGIVKTFKNAAGEFTALKGVNLTIDGGEFVSIVGKSGSGKSTLLNMITGIDHPTKG